MAASTLTAETQRRLEILFKEEDRAEVTRLLVEECGNNLLLLEKSSPKDLERFHFAALRLSGGNLAELRKAVELAKLDWRDLLMSAGFAHDAHAHERWMPSVNPLLNSESKKAVLIDILKRAADQLSPLTHSSEAGWDALKAADGTQLRPKLHWRDVPGRTPSRLAVEWWTRIVTAVDLLQTQDGDLSQSQIEYLRKLLCGGDESFNGVSFDSSQFGDIALITNNAMMERREEFKALFGQLSETRWPKSTMPAIATMSIAEARRRIKEGQPPSHSAELVLAAHKLMDCCNEREVTIEDMLRCLDYGGTIATVGASVMSRK
jgi:hypothetical protein